MFLLLLIKRSILIAGSPRYMPLTHSLYEANDALISLKHYAIHGAGVIVMKDG